MNCNRFNKQDNLILNIVHFRPHDGHVGNVQRAWYAGRGARGRRAVLSAAAATHTRAVPPRPGAAPPARCPGECPAGPAPSSLASHAR